MPEVLCVITDAGTERLLNELSSVDLIPYSVKDDVITNKSLTRYGRASMLLNEIERSLEQSNTLEILKKQDNSALSKIAEIMLKELGEFLMKLLYTHIMF